jgi:hypothetical protein
MGKLTSKDILQTRPPALQIKPIAGWSWYCGHHDTYGIGDDEEEVLYMAGAHMHYFRITDDCEITTKHHQVRREA